MKIINSLDEANAARVGTVVVNGYGEVYQKNQDGFWYGALDASEPTSTEALFFPECHRPVIWSPGDHALWYQDA